MGLVNAGTQNLNFFEGIPRGLRFHSHSLLPDGASHAAFYLKWAVDAWLRGQAATTSNQLKFKLHRPLMAFLPSFKVTWANLIARDVTFMEAGDLGFDDLEKLRR
jgi:hypothetical protein